jgi:hypothetical protein
MIGRKGHILVLVAVLLMLGCTREQVLTEEVPDVILTVRCDDPVLTKADTEAREGESSFNENLIQYVDFLFYPGENPDADTDAVFHIRKALNAGPMQAALWEATFNLVVKKEFIGLIFTEANAYKATVYALVNFDESFIGDLSSTSFNDLSLRRIVTDFSQNETSYIQPSLLMDGKTVVTYQEHASPNVEGDITVSRFAAKLSIAVNVTSEVQLKHLESVNEPDEIWTPVLHSMRIYLVDGVKSVLLSHDGTLPDSEPRDPDPAFFSYSGDSHLRPFLRENGTPYLNTEVVDNGTGEKVYYNTWPMYSYPAVWSSDLPDHQQIDYTQGLPHEAPYFKLEMDWRREARNGYSYDRRKYYYKIFLPFNEFKRNNWYGFYVDVSILGSETDEGKAVLDPTCYLLDWQNKALAINKYATISKARYLSVDKASWDIKNMETLTIPFLSSHNVTVVAGSVTATRPYYGEITKSQPVGSYHQKYHGWIRQKDENSYYLDYTGQPAGNEAYEPSNWLTNTSTAIKLTHALQNTYTADGFDYSPYTIDFDIVHTDLMDNPDSHTYQQYLRHITIIQRPAIYIERLQNRDTEIVAIGGDNPYGYRDGERPWADKPWGYVYLNGGRFVRWDKKSNATSDDPFFSLTTSNAKREYQWQSVWYTGGSRDMFDIHVTVLPAGSQFVIGDPREDAVNNLDDSTKYPGLYEYTVDGKDADAVWNNVRILETVRSGSTEYPEASQGVYRRTGFNEADALYGDEARRPLRWYYPTEKSTRTENMLAPSYRIASKFGGTEYGGSYFGDLTKEYAEYRCAGYQEDGFPAGRWRLPTKAEINFIAQLSAKGVFEFLFGTTVYWSANGAISVNGNGTVTNSNKTTALLRCVYDSWYWDQVDGLEGDPRHEPDHFVWGDMER